MISKETVFSINPPFGNGSVETLFSDRSITVERVCGEAGLFESKRDWEGLFTQAAMRNPFLSWEWMAAWWRHLGRGKLHLLFVRRQGALIGIAPLYVKQIRLAGLPFRALSFLGDEAVGSDHLDFLSRSGCEEEAAEAIVQAWLKGPRDWDFIALRHMAQDSPHAARLLRLSEQGWRVQKREGEVCPFLPLAPTWEAFLNRLSSSMRYTVRRKIRNLEKEHRVELMMIDDLREGRPGMERLIGLHQKRWEDRGGSDAFVADVKLPFHRETAEAFFQKGAARLFFLKADGETVAALYGFVSGERFFYYQAGFNPSWKEKSVGMVLMAKCIETAIKQGWREFDFLRGPEEYKSHWTSDLRHTWHWTLFPPGMKNNVYRLLASCSKSARHWGRRLLPEEWVEKLKGGGKATPRRGERKEEGLKE